MHEAVHTAQPARRVHGGHQDPRLQTLARRSSTRLSRFGRRSPRSTDPFAPKIYFRRTENRAVFADRATAAMAVGSTLALPAKADQGPGGRRADGVPLRHQGDREGAAMALTANRIEERQGRRQRSRRTPGGRDLATGSIEQWWYDHPYPHISILLFERKTYTDQYGHVIGIDSRHLGLRRGDPLGPVAPARGLGLRLAARRHEQVCADQGAGGTDDLLHDRVAHRRPLQRAHDQGRMGDLRPAADVRTRSPRTSSRRCDSPASSTNSEGHNAATRSSYRVAHRHDTGRIWEAAKDSAAIVTKATAPQIALWRDPFEIKEITVEEDFQKTVTSTYEKNLLQPGPPKVERTEQLKDPLAINIPVDLLPPELAASDSGPLGVRLEIKGGGVDLTNMDQWYVQHIEHVRPERYGIYRKTTVEPAPAPSGDPMGLMATPPAYVPSTVGRHLDAVVVTDYTGTPATDLPGIAAPIEPEDPTPPVADVWQRDRRGGQHRDRPRPAGPGALLRHQRRGRAAPTSISPPRSSASQESPGVEPRHGRLRRPAEHHHRDQGQGHREPGRFARRSTCLRPPPDDYGETIAVTVPAAPR